MTPREFQPELDLDLPSPRERGESNSLAERHPHLRDQWHPTKNDGLSPYDVKPMSDRKVWWICSKKHEWDAVVGSRSNGTGCPICSGKRVMVGVNDLATLNPGLAAQWHVEKNGTLSPSAVRPMSHRKVWWLCSGGHEWEDSIAHRSNGRGCRYCARKDVNRGINDLVTVNPELAAQWHSERNGNLHPHDFLPGSGKKVWWICHRGHEWESVIVHRNNGVGCPYCAGQRSIDGENDLATVDPELAAQWHPKLNEDLRPCDVMRFSHHKVWWICSRGHEWQSTVLNRSMGNNCPFCSLQGTSEQEIRLKCELIAAGISISDRRTSITTARNRQVRADIVCPEWNVVIEWDGYRFHSGEDAFLRDCRQSEYLLDAGWRVVRVRQGLPVTSLDDCVVPKLHIHRSKEVVDLVLTHLDRLGFTAPHLHEYLRSQDLWASAQADDELVKIRATSLATERPEIASEWHPTKIGETRPEHVAPAANRAVWWQCRQGHEWRMLVSNRTTKGQRCPYCSGKRILPGVTDLASTNPRLAQEWHPTKNNQLKPTDVKRQSNRKAWWVCTQGHEWEARIYSRDNGHGCPFCTGQKVQAGFNDLATCKPILAQEWNPHRNEGLDPSMVPTQSDRVVWWVCTQAHEWRASIANRANGTGCPMCSGRKVVAGENDFAKLHPESAALWHPTKNEGISPTQFRPHSNRQVWWQCENDHEWKAQIRSLTKTSACPKCRLANRSTTHRPVQSP
ncbi:zinc-ribbon domain-containing protein [Nocardia abscessus]|uniref:zinc-ribbon domain-containing protein n=1 Tax=Nocardia abscessus TaxID=120957 RepID=UPI002457431A|nr:zinc-ribbon domain-containing protein [Nocardia abscessus]